MSSLHQAVRCPSRSPSDPRGQEEGGQQHEDRARVWGRAHLQEQAARHRAVQQIDGLNWGRE